MEKLMKIKIIIDKKLLNNEIKEKELNFFKTGADIYYLSTNDENKENTLYIKESSLVNDISTFMIKLSLMTKTRNIENILFISDNKGLLSLREVRSTKISKAGFIKTTILFLSSHSFSTASGVSTIPPPVLISKLFLPANLNKVSLSIFLKYF